MVIPREKAPYLLVTTSATKDSLPKDRSFQSRFVVLDFSSFFNAANSIEYYFEHVLFKQWDEKLWHQFDNLMIYCILEYIHGYDRGINFIY